jgi:hypothetical protein
MTLCNTFFPVSVFHAGIVFTAQILLIFCQGVIHSVLDMMKLNVLFLQYLKFCGQTFARILDSLTYDIQYMTVKSTKQIGKSTKDT